jgi:hypothetical protein
MSLVHLGIIPLKFSIHPTVLVNPAWWIRPGQRSVDPEDPCNSVKTVELLVAPHYRVLVPLSIWRYQSFCLHWFFYRHKSEEFIPDVVVINIFENTIDVITVVVSIVEDARGSARSNLRRENNGQNKSSLWPPIRAFRTLLIEANDKRSSAVWHKAEPVDNPRIRPPPPLSSCESQA